MIYRYGKNFIAVITLLLVGSSAEAHPLQWYYNNSWLKAACATAFAAYTKKQLEENKQGKDERQAPYTINLMWINKDLKEDDPYMIQPKNKDVVEKYISAPCIWAIKNPDSQVRLWYDSELTSQDSIDRTRSAIDIRMKACPKSAPIVLRDIRELQHVKDNPEVFSTKTPVYFRADLARVIAGYEEVQKAKNNFVYADFDVEPMRKKDLFDDLTKEKVSIYGMVMAHSDVDHYENSFYILGPNEQNMLHSLKTTLIDLNIKRASYALNSYYRYFCMIPDPQIVYWSHRATYAYLYHLQKRGVLKVNKETVYDYDEHGLSAFGIDDLKRGLQFVIPGADSDCSPKDIYYRDKLCFPTKKVTVPPASCDYY